MTAPLPITGLSLSASGARKSDLFGRSGGGRRTRCDVPVTHMGPRANPIPTYALSIKCNVYGSTSVQWSGPSLYDYAWCNLSNRSCNDNRKLQPKVNQQENIQ